MEDLQCFFSELRDQYSKERQNFPWSWVEVQSDQDQTKKFVYFIAYNLSKNILHGPLPSHLHSRMILDKNTWSQRYVDFLEGRKESS